MNTTRTRSIPVMSRTPGMEVTEIQPEEIVVDLSCNCDACRSEREFEADWDRVHAHPSRYSPLRFE